jgi:hypothetical protein
MQNERVHRLSNRLWSPRIELRLQTAFQAAERMPRIRVFLANHIDRQLVVLNESHARRLSLPAEASRKEHRPLRVDGLCPALTDPQQGPCNWLSIPSPQCRPLLSPCANDDAKHRKMRSTHSLLSQPEVIASEQPWFRRRAVALASLYKSPSDKRFHRAPILPYFPAHPRSLASVPIPRPAALVVLLRLAAPFGSGFPATNFRRSVRAAAVRRADEISCRSLHRKHAFGLGSGAHSRRFAQECPEGNSGKYTKEK